MPDSRRLATSTWPDVDAADRGSLVVPLGSTEQHGPHLPCSTDTLIAEAVAAALVDEHPDATLGPSVTIGASGEHAGFPGTLSIGSDVLYNCLLELVRSAVPTWRRVLIVNGHGGNAAALSLLEATCAYEQRTVMVHHCHAPGGDAHAGRTETSLLLHLHPDLVHRDRIAPGNTEPIRDLLPAIRDGGVRAVSTNGVLGDPTKASADEGARLFQQLLRDAADAFSAD